MKKYIRVTLALLAMTWAQQVLAKPYSLSMSYSGTGFVEKASVSYGDYQSLGGCIGRGGGKTEGFVPEPLPERATVVWQRRGGKETTQTVDVGAILKKMPRGDRKNIDSLSITMTDDDRAVARLLVDGDLDARVYKRTMYPDVLDAQYGKYVELCMACSKGGVTEVKALVEAGAPLAWPDLDGHSPMVWSTVRDNAEAARYLLEQMKVDISLFEIRQCALFSVQNGNADLLNTFLALVPKGADVSELMRRVLTKAARSNKPEIISLLKKRGVDLSLRTSDVGHTAVMTAVQSRNLEALTALLEQGADPNPVVGGRSAYEWAFKEEFREVLKKHGGKPLLRGHAKLVEYRKNVKNKGEKREIVHHIGKRLDGDKYAAPDGLFKIDVPALSGEDVKLVELEMNPGITTEVRFEDDFGQALVIVCTKIRDGLPKDERILDRVARSYPAASSPDAVDGYTWKKSGFGRMMNMLMVNQEYGEFFPCGFSMSGANDELTNMVVDRFIVSKGYLFEFAMIAPVQPGMDAGKLKRHVESCMDKAMESFAMKPQ